MTQTGFLAKPALPQLAHACRPVTNIRSPFVFKDVSALSKDILTNLFTRRCAPALLAPASQPHQQYLKSINRISLGHCDRSAVSAPAAAELLSFGSYVTRGSAHRCSGASKRSSLAPAAGDELRPWPRSGPAAAESRPSKSFSCSNSLTASSSVQPTCNLSSLWWSRPASPVPAVERASSFQKVCHRCSRI